MKLRGWEAGLRVARLTEKAVGRCINDGAVFLRKTEKLLPPSKEKLVLHIPGAFSRLLCAVSYWGQFTEGRCSHPVAQTIRLAESQGTPEERALSPDACTTVEDGLRAAATPDAL